MGSGWGRCGGAGGWLWLDGDDIDFPTALEQAEGGGTIENVPVAVAGRFPDDDLGDIAAVRSGEEPSDEGGGLDGSGFCTELAGEG